MLWHGSRREICPGSLLAVVNAAGGFSKLWRSCQDQTNAQIQPDFVMAGKISQHRAQDYERQEGRAGLEVWRNKGAAIWGGVWDARRQPRGNVLHVEMFCVFSPRLTSPAASSSTFLL